MRMNYTRELELALSLARRAGDIQKTARLARGDIERKADASPVTAIDRRCEDLIRDGLLSVFKDDGFLGEESGTQNSASGRQWIVDPLDGTRPFIRGIPTYASLIALEEAGEPVVGVMHLPMLNETYWAARGGGAFLNGTPLHVSSIRDLAHAMGSSLGHIEKRGESMGARVLELMGALDYAYGFMDSYSYGCIAAGRLDLCVNLLDKPWDCAAGACIVTEAGGVYSDIHGHRTVHGGSIVLTNGHLHEAVLARLAG